MDDVVGALVEGAFKVLMGLTLIIAAPVLAIYFAVKGVVWVVSNYWPYMVGGLGLLVVLAIVVVAIKACADYYVAGSSKRSAMRRLDAVFKASSLRMEDIARVNAAGNPSKSVVSVITPSK